MSVSIGAAPVSALPISCGFCHHNPFLHMKQITQIGEISKCGTKSLFAWSNIQVIKFFITRTKRVCGYQNVYTLIAESDSNTEVDGSQYPLFHKFIKLQHEALKCTFVSHLYPKRLYSDFLYIPDTTFKDAILEQNKKERNDCNWKMILLLDLKDILNRKKHSSIPV